MTGSKRGRPALPDDQKRQQIGVRTSPSLKASLEQAAAEKGRSVAQEAEWRLQQSFDDEQRAGGEHTASLLRIVAAEIEKIEASTGKRWSKNLTTWAAVARMFQYGPIRQARPDRTSDDEAVMKPWNKMVAAREEKREICATLGDIGVFATPELPEKPVKRSRGLFGASARLSKDGGVGGVNIEGLLARYAGTDQTTPSRDRERQRVRDLNEDEATTAELIALVDRLEELDEAHRTAEADWTKALEPYHEAEAEGVQLYQDMMQRRALELMRQGDFTLMGEAF